MDDGSECRTVLVNDASPTNEEAVPPVSSLSAPGAISDGLSEGHPMSISNVTDPGSFRAPTELRYSLRSDEFGHAGTRDTDSSHAGSAVRFAGSPTNEDALSPLGPKSSVSAGGKKSRGPSISFARNPEASVQVDVVNCGEPGPSSPTKAPARESILRSDAKDSSQDKSGRYIVRLPQGKDVAETQYYYTVTDVAVRESARMQSKRVEIIRALTLLEPIDVNGPDTNFRKFLKLGYKRWVYDRAKDDSSFNIRQVFHLDECFFFIIWSAEALRVVLLDSQGPVQNWNDKQREENLVHACVEVHDFIVEINGQTQAHEMIREIGSTQPLQMKIHRDPPKMPERMSLDDEEARCCCWSLKR